jgi:hypothetical protein
MLCSVLTLIPGNAFADPSLPFSDYFDENGSDGSAKAFPGIRVRTEHNIRKMPATAATVKNFNLLSFISNLLII